MGNAILAGLFENWPKYDIGEGAFMAVFGFAFVFLGIVIMILLFTGLGKIMSVINGKKKGKSSPVASVKPNKVHKQEETDDELIAVITAAIAAYYEGENTKCDFVVRRIKKL